MRSIKAMACSCPCLLKETPDKRPDNIPDSLAVECAWRKKTKRLIKTRLALIIAKVALWRCVGQVRAD